MSKRKNDGYATYKNVGTEEQMYQPDDKEIIIEDMADLDIFLNSSLHGLCVLYVYAPWCGPCKVVGPKYFELCKQYPKINMRKINGENDICGERGIRKMFNAFPTFLYFKGGKLIDKVVGADLTTIEAKIHKHK
jgi:thioredoxin 1